MQVPSLPLRWRSHNRQNLAGLDILRAFIRELKMKKGPFSFKYKFFSNFVVQTEAGYTAQGEDYITLAIRHGVRESCHAESNGTALLPDT